MEQRAKDAIARLLVEMLQVPFVYFDAPWKSSKNKKRADLLAIDRAGVGDVHVVEIKQTFEEALGSAAQLIQIPAQFRWVAFYNGAALENVESLCRKAERAPLFAAEGMGRVGVIEVHREEDQFGEKLEAIVLVRAERFAGSLHDQARKFSESHDADIMFK